MLVDLSWSARSSNRAKGNGPKYKNVGGEGLERNALKHLGDGGGDRSCSAIEGRWAETAVHMSGNANLLGRFQ